MRRFIFALISFLLVLFGLTLGLWLSTKLHDGSLWDRFTSSQELINPFVPSSPKQPLPLEKYTITNLKTYPYLASQITLTQLLEEKPTYSSYLFEYQTMGKTMTGTANLPTASLQEEAQPAPVVILIRGYATPEQYTPGFGTRNAAAVFAQNGYVTLAIDFFGFAGADPEPEDSWEARFIKPINIIELIKSLQETQELQLHLASTEPTQTNPNNQTSALAVLTPNQAVSSIAVDSSSLYIWSHSNGGQIALSVLQVLSEPIPTTLWAPVTAPFPYSILFFTRTSEDEGKETRAWLAMFEREYDVFEFSVTQHLDLIEAPLQVHHGSSDQDALLTWSESFAQMIDDENQRRQEESLDEIEFEFYKYSEADHNLQPPANWQQAIQRDLIFFERNQ